MPTKSKNTLDAKLSTQGMQDGIEAAITHADRNSPGWSGKALTYLQAYPHNQFMAEDVRVWAHEQGLEHPPHARAWGAVMQTARRLQIIKKHGLGYVSNPKAHRTPATIWTKK